MGLCFKVGCKMMIDDRVLRLCFKVGCKMVIDDRVCQSKWIQIILVVVFIFSRYWLNSIIQGSSTCYL